MRERTGLPIAAYLGLLVALALAAAFVATLAIVIFLPPRPPDVMRADKVAEHFQEGYDHMTTLGRTPSEDGVIWQVQSAPPDKSDSPHLLPTHRELAQVLDLQHSQVRVFADRVATNDVFVFRVADVEAMTRGAELSAEEAERIAEEVQRAHEEAADRLDAARERAREAADRLEVARERARELAAERDHARQEHAAEIEQARLEAAAARAEAQAELMAERQARAALRMAARIEQRIRIENGQVIIRGEAGAPDVRVNVDVDAPAVEVDPVEGVRVMPPPPPAPVTSASPAPAPAPVAPPAPAADAAAAMPPVFAPAPAGVVLISGFEFGAQLPDGRWLVMSQGRNWAELGWIARAALVIGGTLLVLSVLAVLFARRLTQPIRSFADTVQAVGVDPQSEPVREEGPRELRSAARAVNTMQARLRALIADRTKTLAAVAHDMRTPLMRLRLVAENAAPEQREKMAKEIDEVEALVASFIAFARDDPAEEARVRLDLAALLQSIADDHAEAGRAVSFAEQARVIVTGQSLGLKRLFSNLVDNALKYGSGARIKLARQDGAVIIDIEDDGPGIPAEQRETVFEPFVRLNEEGTRGAGLGLAAARSIARAHGGDIAILDTAQGALLRVTLPDAG